MECQCTQSGYNKFDTCAGECTKTCNTECTDTCKDSSLSQSCMTCGGNCTGSCVTSCQGRCVTSCSGSCNTSCVQACSDDCGGSCRGGCSSSCRGGCGGGCTSCTDGCFSSCSGSCSEYCGQTCRNNCNTSCGSNCVSSATNDPIGYYTNKLITKINSNPSNIVLYPNDIEILSTLIEQECRHHGFTPTQIMEIPQKNEYIYIKDIQPFLTNLIEIGSYGHRPRKNKNLPATSSSGDNPPQNDNYSVNKIPSLYTRISLDTLKNIISCIQKSSQQVVDLA